MSAVRPSVAVGPVHPGWGSWEWVGGSFCDALAFGHDVRTFGPGEVPDADLVMLVKHPPSAEWIDRVAVRSPVIYCPVDCYGAAGEIAADAGWLRKCARILCHARSLVLHFEPYAPTEYLDHPLRYAVPPRVPGRPVGDRFLWVGVRSNLEPLVAWVNARPLPGPLDVLTNPEVPGSVPSASELGFAAGRDVAVHEWSPVRHLVFASTCRAALDVKGTDFRSRHKPPAKAFDFVASGIPLALDPDHPSRVDLADCGLAAADPNDPERWLSAEYAAEVRAAGERLRADLAPAAVWGRIRAVVADVLASRPRPTVAAPFRRPVRVAVLSLLFNWPSTGGGTVHTAELCRFLAEAGYEVRHLYARFDPWGVGQVTGTTPHPAVPLEFSPGEWTAERIVARFRAEVDAFDPDTTIVTDSWNFKPLLARAAGPRPYLLRLQALECLCPLNNVRLLPRVDGPPGQCSRNQLADPAACRDCVRRWDDFSGDLHRADRELAGVDGPEYAGRLRRAFAEARAVLAVNPESAALVRPFAREVRVVTAGMDPARFPRPGGEPFPPPTPGKLRIAFAGLTGEWIKGFHVLRDAARLLATRRSDFEVVATDAPPRDAARGEPIRYLGWQSQADLPRVLWGADVVAVPAVAQEALGRTAVEGMAAGRPVVAARIGGLPTTVPDGVAGLLFEPGRAVDLAHKIEILLDDSDLRLRLGRAGRARFEACYSWPAIVEQHYRPLLG